MLLLYLSKIVAHLNAVGVVSGSNLEQRQTRGAKKFIDCCYVWRVTLTVREGGMP